MNIGLPRIAAIAGLTLAIAGHAHAADTMGTPVGHIVLTAKSADVGVGYTWGEGTLSYGHHTYHFHVSGADIAAVGYATVEARATVYDLKHVHDFDGTYGALSGEATLDKGLGGAVLSNSNGVRLKLDSVTKGARLAAGAQGLTFTLDH
ncbi:hypothetical protein [Tanticharoenia sakaeratensis]|uniref:DUF1134 domain-containing protein n=1 Tax=Tanticharoenia sakaeratensis NBRC 103193 TaxID=1231623 RepID=A0A0D6MLQ4_9PROT|nr:hypothetical protein [Tanticharoenia sakaeratensis]GAN54609.1 hypothetical protein Tasa_025_040 [Tanticharoenia sakaeratensis NBRC 103193]GBQ22993.1 hypothetical protein AA103193_2258 [Tanticharoenia sakaeratensis NBRC 103193]